MGETLTEIIEGSLVRETGSKDRLRCTLNIDAAGFVDPGGHGGAVLRIASGSVVWDYLGAPATVVGGEIDLFRPQPERQEQASTDYRFRFMSEGATFVCRGEKHLGGTDAAADLSSIVLDIEGPAGVEASGVLSSDLHSLLQSFEGRCMDMPRAAPGDENGRRALLDYVNRALSAAYPHLPTLLGTGRVISDGLRKTLRLLAEVMLPDPLPADGPSIDDVAGGIESFLKASSDTRAQLVRTALQVISLFVPVLRLQIKEIRKSVAAALDDDDKDSPLRQALSSIHQIVVFAYYAHPRVDRRLGYRRPVHRPAHATALRVSTRVPDREFDVVIAGTGPAGSLLADRLTARGKSVLLLEAGPYIPEQDITADELLAIARLYKMSGLQSSKAPSSITVLQGSCVGGGGVVNNGIFFPLAQSTLDTWRTAGFPFDTADMTAAYRVTGDDLKIGPVSRKAQRLNPAVDYLKTLGVPQAPPTGPMPPGLYEMLLNLETQPQSGEETGCLSTGLCNLGCGSERKVNSFQLYLKNAFAVGRDATLVDRAFVAAAVMGIGVKRGTVTALEVRRADGSTVLARGREFVLCCGPVGSSAVLLRSSALLAAAASRQLVGQRFCGNVATPVFATAPTPVNRETYVQMCHVFVPAPGDDGFLIETWFTPPGSLALAMPGFMNTHRERMGRYPNLIGASPVVGTQPIGRITLAGDDASIDLRLTTLDLDRIRRGLVTLASAFVETAAPVVVRLGNGFELRTKNDVDVLDQRLAAITPDDLHKLPLSTAHPQGGNAMSGDESVGVVDADFRVRGIDNLRICDASVFPGVAGVNPQWTIYALAHLCAQSMT